jgi:ectoine hydroxylase-related dioxygenase (phytanoyl-CoA dioxygenase family)
MALRPPWVLSDGQVADFATNGFLRFPSFVPPATCTEMMSGVVDIVRRHAAGEPTGGAVVLPEANLAGRQAQPEQLVSKVFRLHRDPVFARFAASGEVTDIVADLVGPALDCFLSQFIFKNTGAWGQPWHQDSFYFPFEPPRPIVGVWLAVAAATLENGCLHVVPGSHHEPVHEHVPDRRAGANYGYVEIIDHDMTAAVPVFMEPGDLLVFDSHLMHRSTDNLSAGIRAAMVYHYAASGTVETVPGLVNAFVAVRT